jgi:hypothetical protein
MLLAALPPDTIPALLRTISTQQHPAASGYLHTVQLNLGYESAHPTLADILAATDTITRCATEADHCTIVPASSLLPPMSANPPNAPTLQNCKASPPVPLRTLLR